MHLKLEVQHASNIEFIKKSLARQIDGVESPTRQVDRDERFKRMSRSPHTSSARQKLCRQSDSPKNPEQRVQNPSKQSQARRSISFNCSTATSSSSTPIDEEVRGLADLGSRVVQND